MRTRNWSIRSKIIALVAVPVLTLLAQWIFVTTLTAGPAVNLLSAQTLLSDVAKPGKALLGALQRERRLTVEFLSAADASPAAMSAQRLETDKAAVAFRAGATSENAQDAAGDAVRLRVDRLIADVGSLTGNRGHVDRRAVDPVGAQNLYNSILDSGFQLFTSFATFGDERVDEQIRALTSIALGSEHLARVDSLLAGAQRAGEFGAQARIDLLTNIATSRFLMGQGVTDLPVRDRTSYQKLYSGPAYTKLRELQDNLVAGTRPGTASPVTGAEWKTAYDAFRQEFVQFERAATESVTGDAMPFATRVLVRLVLGGLLGLIALIVSLVVAIKVGRSIVGRLGRLRGEALELAGERLPAVVRRLQRGEAVDVEVETPPLEYGRDEIGQLGHAFNEVQRTAVQSAVEEANVRRGINEVFLNIARRSQTLLHRQLALLDKMERRETEPDELEDLYRVDHLATRMRRHAEDLVILAGAAPGRGWRNPVPVIDVVRGAISEVEDYKRVDIVSIESAAVLGRAVGDVIHLLAELLENAASFSPPQTRVQVVGQVLPNGYALEIEDRGLGMSPEALAEANRKLLEPPDFDPADSARLGLFVVAQLAHRQGIRVSLRPSGYGGVTAIVLVPGELVAGGAARTALPAGTTPPDQSWDRPLVGTGTEDPARSSLAALQWQGTEELRSIAVPGRPVTINGTATPVPEPVDRAAGPGADLLDSAAGTDVTDPTRPLSRHGLGMSGTPVAEPTGTVGGPAPSAVVDGLTEDGLVQRRRTKPRRPAGEPAAPPALLPPNLTSPAGLTPPGSLGSDLPSVGDGRTATGNGLAGGSLNGSGFPGAPPAGNGLAGGSVNGARPSLDSPLRHGEGPALLPGPGATPLPGPRIPTQRTAPDELTAAPIETPAPGKPEPATPDALAPGRPAAEPAGDDPLGDEPLLPRRVRQASLAPQLRGPVAEQAAAPARSPEQVRKLMSALQRGTTRGRLEAAGLAAAQPGKVGDASDDRPDDRPETDKQETVGDPMWSQAATVVFPAVQDPVAAGSDDSTDYAPENHENRPDKDA
ncbi:nitrate- and nitrite sensing domain-containing protein [Actinoplanes sp. NPDC049599]|uniref:nitrate- and nitrite sensing domain-containing protein n=1 Tax=Actinoplanes sp. NPDC049599 TaxID=3363903 RepID=UPI0037910A93